LYIIPFQRGRIKDKLRDNINRVRKLLSQVLEEHFNRELEVASRQIRDSFSNYSHFVQNATSRVHKLGTMTDQLTEDLNELSAEVQKTESQLMKKQKT